MYARTARVLTTVVITGVLSVAGATAANAVDTNSLLGGLTNGAVQLPVNVNVPVDISGNSLNVLGGSVSGGGITSTTAPTSTVPTITVPVNVSGNSVSVLSGSTPAGTATGTNGVSVGVGIGGTGVSVPVNVSNLNVKVLSGNKTLSVTTGGTPVDVPGTPGTPDVPGLPDVPGTPGTPTDPSGDPTGTPTGSDPKVSVSTLTGTTLTTDKKTGTVDGTVTTEAAVSGPAATIADAVSGLASKGAAAFNSINTSAPLGGDLLVALVLLVIAGAAISKYLRMRKAHPADCYGSHCEAH